MTPALLGTKAVLMDRWDRDVATTTIESEHISYMVGAPVFLQDLIAAHPPTSGPGLRLFSCGVVVSDIYSHYERATAAGAVVVGTPAEDHGSIGYRALDCEGHRWLFSQQSEDSE